MARRRDIKNHNLWVIDQEGKSIKTCSRYIKIKKEKKEGEYRFGSPRVGGTVGQLQQIKSSEELI